ncbi:MAG: hypothetical protein P8009_08945 [Gammaproteobacteria bacterium]|nr:hypothetical protein [Gammaproteobacteria bacterium]
MKSIQLSDALIDELQNVIARYEPEAGEDAGISVQYLAAVIGYMIAQFPAAPAERREFLEHLNGLTQHVLDDCEQSAAKAQAQPGGGAEGHIEPSSDDPAMGIWRAKKD